MRRENCSWEIWSIVHPRSIRKSRTTDSRSRSGGGLLHNRSGTRRCTSLDRLPEWCLGTESLSRGASHATFVEKDRRHARILRDNLDHIKCPSSDVDVVVSDVLDRSIDCILSANLRIFRSPHGKGMVNETFERFQRKRGLPGGNRCGRSPSRRSFHWGRWSAKIDGCMVRSRSLG